MSIFIKNCFCECFVLPECVISVYVNFKSSCSVTISNFTRSNFFICCLCIDIIFIVKENSIHKWLTRNVPCICIYIMVFIYIVIGTCFCRTTKEALPICFVRTIAIVKVINTFVCLMRTCSR
uniref:hypothetical protein n=1 Tax=Flammeovirga pectinis TaxID=2494373 RepID=UPI0037433C5E